MTDIESDKDFFMGIPSIMWREDGEKILFDQNNLDSDLSMNSDLLQEVELEVHNEQSKFNPDTTPRVSNARQVYDKLQQQQQGFSEHGKKKLSRQLSTTNPREDFLQLKRKESQQQRQSQKLQQAMRNSQRLIQPDQALHQQPGNQNFISVIPQSFEDVCSDLPRSQSRLRDPHNTSIELKNEIRSAGLEILEEHSGSSFEVEMKKSSIIDYQKPSELPQGQGGSQNP